MSNSPIDLEIPNTKEAVREFIETNNISVSSAVVGAESTGRYQLCLQEIFVQEGYEFRILNPILTNKKICTTIRKKKTDISDAQIIAHLLQQGEGRIVKEEDLEETKKVLLRTRKSVVTHKSALKRVIKDLKSLKNNPQIVGAISSLQDLVDAVEECVEEIEKNALSTEATEAEKLIQSIPGFATQLSAVVASEVGNFSRFPSSTQFKAYVGIDPKVTQSGGMLKTGRITKRGNPHLRWAFYLAAQVARIHDPELRVFYEKKVSEGKNFRVAVCAVARKLCERVFAVVTKGVPYQIRQVSFS